MPSKNTSPEAAQSKVWKSELKILESNRKKVGRDIDAQFRASLKETVAFERAAQQARKKHNRTCKRLEAAERRQFSGIDRRIGILKGRLGI